MRRRIPTVNLAVAMTVPTIQADQPGFEVRDPGLLLGAQLGDRNLGPYLGEPARNWSEATCLPCSRPSWIALATTSAWWRADAAGGELRDGERIEHRGQPTTHPAQANSPRRPVDSRRRLAAVAVDFRRKTREHEPDIVVRPSRYRPSLPPAHRKPEKDPVDDRPQKREDPVRQVGTLTDSHRTRDALGWLSATTTPASRNVVTTPAVSVPVTSA